MKQITAFVHRGRVADIVHALAAAGHRHLSVLDVKGLLRALSEREETYSLELGERVTNEIRLDLVCEDGEVEHAVALIRQFGRTGQRISGWVYVSPVDFAVPIDGGLAAGSAP